MCLIVDANIAHNVFGKNRPEAGAKLFEWFSVGAGRLVVGGDLLDELNKTSARNWIREAINAGVARSANEKAIEEKKEALCAKGDLRSDDPHVLALAQVSGARLLYSNDRNLQQDFKNSQLIDNPRGKVYSTLVHEHFHDSHKQLLKRTDLCDM